MGRTLTAESTRKTTYPCLMQVLVVDNYDSFVFNLVQYLGELGAEPVVYRNDAIDVTAAVALEPDGVLVVEYRVDAVQQRETG